MLATKQYHYLPKVRTNYGVFNIRFQGPTVWNSIDGNINSSSIAILKTKIKVINAFEFLHFIFLLFFL